MVTSLKQLLFCAAIFYSFNSHAWYNEAMCLLLKQEIKQLSVNKNTRAYRNATKSYDRSCSAEQRALALQKQEQEQAKVAIAEQSKVAIIEQPKIAVIEQPKVAVIEQPKVAVIEQPKVAEKEAETAQEKPNENIEQTKKTVPQANAMAEPPVTETLVEKASPKHAEPIQVPNPAESSESSNTLPGLLIPSIIILVIVLFTVIFITALRRRKKAVAVTPELTRSAVKLAPERDIKPIDTKPIAADEDTEQTLLVSEPIAASPAPASHRCDSTEANQPELLPSNEPSAEQFEQAAKNTFAQINSAAEPVANHPAPSDNSLAQMAEQQTKAEDSEQQPEQQCAPEAVEQQPAAVKQSDETTAAIQPEHNAPSQTLAVDVLPDDQTADVATPNEPEDKAVYRAPEHVFKEPEVRTFDPDAPLPGVKTEPKKQTTKVQQSQVQQATPQQPTTEQNPFANLSLDESWDPNSTEKPKVEPKAKAPKSQALIEAEERAKKLQTKE